jgi:spermidine/putrescine transport system substrate-binding protein
MEEPMHSWRSRSAIRGSIGLVVISLMTVACGAGATTAPTVGPTGGATPEPTAAATDIPTDITGSLSVLDWSGYDAPDFWTDFQSTYANVDVAFEFGISDADIYGKMKGGSAADVFHPYTGWLQFYVDEGLVAEIDTSRLTNWDKVPESFKAIGQIDGKQYFIPWDWGFSSILYRTDKVEGEVDSWDALLDPAYAGHISMWDDGPAAVTVSSYIHGYDETAITDEQLADIKAEWTAQAPLNVAYWAAESDLVPLMQNGDAWVAYAWQGAYATLLGEGVAVAYANPTEGRNSWVGVYGISAASPNYDLALKFLDLKLADVTSANLPNLYYYGSANGDVMAAITDETLKAAFSIDNPDILETTNFTPNLTAEQRDAWTAMWAEVKASQ